MLWEGLHLPTRFNGSATKHLIHVGLNNLEMLLLKSLAMTMLQEIKDLKHDLIANLFAREQLGGVDGHGVTPGELGLTTLKCVCQGRDLPPNYLLRLTSSST